MVKQRRNKTSDHEEHEPYDEPHPSTDTWPDDWTPKQRTNWLEHGAIVYNNLETEQAQYWYRRTWRPKCRNSGMMKCDHVKLGTPEDYIEENVSDTLNPMGNMTSVMMRQVSRYSVDRDVLDDVVDDIVQAKIQNMSEAQQQRLVGDAQRLANAYGLSQ